MINLKEKVQAWAIKWIVNSWFRHALTTLLGTIMGLFLSSKFEVVVKLGHFIQENMTDLQALGLTLATGAIVATFKWIQSRLNNDEER
ncbi:MAG: hypothetical protein KDH96_09125 [Candidatus Riesia sp.]|nr:hypothetical protein [Candidatus Riesia sp.]